MIGCQLAYEKDTGTRPSLIPSTAQIAHITNSPWHKRQDAELHGSRLVLLPRANPALLPDAAHEPASSTGAYQAQRTPCSLYPLLTTLPQNSHAKNPVRVLAQLNRHQWLMFWAGFLGWTWDAFDFFTVSLTVTEIAKDFHVKNSDVSWVRSP